MNQLNERELESQHIIEQTRIYQKKGGTILRCSMGATANSEMVSGAQRARAGSSANKHQLSGAKNAVRKPTRGKHPNSHKFNVT
jgi:hypothetical protein